MINQRVLAAVTDEAIQNALEIFSVITESEDFTDDQQAKACEQIANGVTDGLAKFADDWRKHLADPRTPDPTHQRVQ